MKSVLRERLAIEDHDSADGISQSPWQADARMSISSIIDTLCAYLNTLASFLGTLQRLKNEYHAKDIDYSHLLLNLLSQPDIDASHLGHDCNLLEETPVYEAVFISALVSLAVYHPVPAQDWTCHMTPFLRRHLRTGADPWRRDHLRPVVIDLYESHYMSTSKAHVFMGIYRPLETIVLSLPGTNSRTDWLSNLHSTSTDFPHASGTLKVHAGFLYMAQCLATHPAIITYLKDAVRSGFKKVLMCGHSQAGAVVSLLSLLVESEFPGLEIQVVTFGSGACVKSPSISVETCRSFVRCVRVAKTWHVDPVPILDDGILTHGDGGRGMSPMGSIFTLLDAHEDVTVKQLEPGQIAALTRNALVNFSADPHSMKGYLRAILRLGQMRHEDDLVHTEYLAMLGNDDDNNDLEAADDEIAALQLTK